LIHPFEQVFEAVEPALPEAFHLSRPIDQRAQGAHLGAVVRLSAVMSVAHEPSLFQHAKMLRDGGLRHAGVSGQRSDRLLASAAKALEDCAPGRVGERSEEHVVSVGHAIDNQLIMN
jgi:hypothetical protein